MEKAALGSASGCMRPHAARRAFSSIELFAGAGGLALGFEKAGFEALALVELDRDAAGTLRSNRPGWNVICDDIRGMSGQDLKKRLSLGAGELDLLSGGPPCQPFSYAGKRLGLDDQRGTLFFRFAEFLEKLRPNTFLLENVRGLLTHGRGRTYEAILAMLAQAGYEIQKKILNALDYGVAQKRERLITIGIRCDLAGRLKIDFPEPHACKPVLRDALKDVPQSAGARYSESKRRVFEMVPPGGHWRDVPEGAAREYMKSCWGMGGGRTGILRRMSLDEPSLAVLASPSQKLTDRCHPLEARPFSVRENARIQCFPDDWRFCGSVSSQYRQVGNAVPVLLAFSVAKEMRRGLDRL